jgi:tetratricopeptide (TPR) repeat protein
MITAQELSKIEEAIQLYENEQWEEAIIAYEKLIDANSTKGEYFYKLATALRKQEKYRASIDAYLMSLNIGYKKGRCVYFIAKNHSMLNNQSEALKWIRIGLRTPKSIYYSDIKTDASFDNLRKLEAFKNLYPEIKNNASRSKRWSTDLSLLKRAFETIHYDLYRKISLQDWDSSINTISANIDNLSDDEIIVKLMQLVGKVGDGHTFLRPPIQGNYKLHFYPVQLYQFKEGVFVTAINKKYADVVGSELTHIDGVQIKDVLKTFKTVLSVDNAMGYKENVYLTMFSEVLHVLKITKQNDQAEFTFKTHTKKSITKTIVATDFNPALWNTKVKFKSKELPLYRSNPAKYFWYKHLPEYKSVYIQLNINFSMPDKDIEDFYNEVFAFIDFKDVKRLILDIRNCPGGNSFNNKPLIQHILKNKNLQERGALYTIIGRKTFSAAMNLATDLEQWTNTIFIGEPTGSSPNFVGETNFVELPYSKLNVSISNAYWQRSVSWDERNWIAPDVYLEPTFEAFKNSEDPVMNYILNKIDN